MRGAWKGQVMMDGAPLAGAQVGSAKRCSRSRNPPGHPHQSASTNSVCIHIPPNPPAAQHVPVHVDGANVRRAHTTRVGSCTKCAPTPIRIHTSSMDPAWKPPARRHRCTHCTRTRIHTYADTGRHTHTHTLIHTSPSPARARARARASPAKPGAVIRLPGSRAMEASPSVRPGREHSTYSGLSAHPSSPRHLPACAKTGSTPPNPASAGLAPPAGPLAL